MKAARSAGAPLQLEAALSLARRQLGGLDPAVVAGKARVEYEDGSFLVPYFRDWYGVAFPTGDVARLKSDSGPVIPGEVPKITQTLLLHYLLGASGSDLSGRWVSYRELPQGDSYERAFRQRAIAPIEVGFGYDLPGFIAAGAAAGGHRARLGDASFYFRVLPRVPLLCTLWIGDDEVPPGANILFDASAGNYLPSEDLAYLGIALAGRLLGAKNGMLLT